MNFHLFYGKIISSTGINSRAEHDIQNLTFVVQYFTIMVFERCIEIASYCTIVQNYTTHHACFLFTATSTNTNEASALANNIEVLVAGIKRRSHRLYMDTDSNKGRAKIRSKIRKEKGILTSLIDRYNEMVPSTESLCLETILSEDAAWPWQLPHSGRYTSMFNAFCKCDTHTHTHSLMPQKLIVLSQMLSRLCRLQEEKSSV